MIELRPSRRLLAFLVAAHLAAIIAAVAGLPAIPVSIVSAALVLSLLGQLQVARLVRPGSVKALQIAADGLVQIRDPQGGWHRVVLAGHAFANAWLVILPLDEPSGGRHTAVLLADSAVADDLRRLRVWLRWGEKPRNEGRLPTNQWIPMYQSELFQSPPVCRTGLGAAGAAGSDILLAYRGKWLKKEKLAAHQGLPDE